MALASKKLMLLLVGLAILSLSLTKAEDVDSIPAALKKVKNLTAPKCPKIKDPSVVINSLSWTPNHIKAGETLNVTYNVDILKEVEQPIVNLDLVAEGFIPVSKTLDICSYGDVCPLKVGHYEGEASVVVPDFDDPVPFSADVAGAAKLLEKGSKDVIGCYPVKASVGTLVGDAMKAEF